ncbi:MAG: hypothetical protein ACRD28_14465 [Acidobacteriaceae bacterium]
MKAIVSLLLGLQLAAFSAYAAVPNAQTAAPGATAAISTTAAVSTTQQKTLDEIARVATIMIDGDVCQHIVTARALSHMLHPDPSDKWQAGDNYDVNAAPFIQTKKTLIRLAMLAPFPVDVNLWMPVPTTQDIQAVIRNQHDLSQFYKFGELKQAMPAPMQQVLKTGNRVTVQEKPGMISVLAPVRNSLGQIVGLVEVCSSTHLPTQGDF